MYIVQLTRFREAPAVFGPPVDNHSD